MNNNARYYNGNSFINDFIYSKELYSLMNHRISTELKDYSFILLDNSSLLMNYSINEWSFHIMNDKLFWNKNSVRHTFELFSIFDMEIQGFIFYNWIKNLMYEKLNKTFETIKIHEDSSSNRTILLDILVKNRDIFKPLELDKKYLNKNYWDDNPIFKRLNNFNLKFYD